MLDIKFEEVPTGFTKFGNIETHLPQRADELSAGYDFEAKEEINLIRGGHYLFWTDVRAKMPEGVGLFMDIRSGLGTKHGLSLRNTIGVIDASYYDNADTKGNIGICLINNSDSEYHVSKGDRIAQGVFMPYLKTIDDQPRNEVRSGGFGSSGK